MCARAVLAKLIPRLRSLWRCSAGVAAVEFAIVSPLVVMLLVGTYSVGSVLHCLSSVRYALEETARVLQLNPKLTKSELQAVIDKKLKNYGKQAITLSMSVQKDGSGSDIAQLTATYPYLLAVPFIPHYEGSYTQSVDIFLVIAP